MSDKIPSILQAAWSVCTPREQQLVDQVVPAEKLFLIKFSEYITQVYPDKEPLSYQTKELLIREILETANSRIAALAKEVTPSLTHAVVAVVLYLLSNILSNEYVKYKTQDAMLAAYPMFSDRSDIEKQHLFLTANWMDVLFRVIPARKNKGIAMDIIPKFVEGNGAHYVTGGGQTQATKDRVFVYETEGDCRPIKRLKRKSKLKLEEEERIAREEGHLEGQPRKKVTTHLAPPNIESGDNNAQNVNNLYYPLPAPFFQALPLPIPVISPRSQSSFSQAASVIANFGQVPPPLPSISRSSNESSSNISTTGDKSCPSNSYMVSPRECYLDVESDGTVVKKYSPRPSSSPLSVLSAQAGKRAMERDNSFGTKPPPPNGFSRVTSPPPPPVSRSSTFDKFVEAITTVNVDEDGDHLAMLREVSADSDI